MVKGSSTDCSIAGIRVADSTQQEIVEVAAKPAGDQPRLVYALHVGGLLHRHDSAFRSALDGADVVYADGAAVVLLAKAAGARRIQRAATTDIGVDVINVLSRNLGRPARLALVGAKPGVAERAARALTERSSAEIVLVADGYFDDDSALVTELRLAEPDMVVVGLGMPYEATWTHSRRTDLPQAVIMTCGGWFGFLAGDERRAPEWLQSIGLEWSYRLSQDFPRLFSRYSRGALEVAQLLPLQIRQRILGR